MKCPFLISQKIFNVGDQRRITCCERLSSVQVILTELIGISDFVNPSKTLSVVSEDAEDNRILECALEAKANYIVTGDIHLLKLGGYRDIKILNAVAFLEEISSGT
ncbi:MAG: putative toxin-antitoxin system toxin component, PIN family [Syntrophaceae bacterium]|nr:putative toxin-antitoxin system toxin component, PIN family [Syntrophaceae bacterium]